MDALFAEIEGTLDFLPSRHIDTVYLGGGTPTLLSIRELESILTKIRKHYFISSDAECTIEANPEQLDKTYLKDLQSIGINRLSIGVQSFNDETLQFLGRKHNAEEAEAAVHLAAAAGYDNISIDLIYGISQRQPGEWEADLRKAFSLPIQHLSCYALTNEENSLLWRKIKQHQLPDMDEDLANKEFYTLLQMALENGFEQYEISNFARNGQVSRHNSAYWSGEPYLGLGPSAHSFDGKTRKWNVSNLLRYIDDIATGKFSGDSETLSLDDGYNEYVMLGLRTSGGIDLEVLGTRFGQAYRKMAERQLRQVSPNHYLRQGNKIRLTDEGKFFADGIAAGLFTS